MSSINGTSIIGSIANALTISVALPIQNQLEITANFAIPFSNSARFVGYDNDESGLVAENVQDAIDEIVNETELKDLKDVSISSPLNNHTILYRGGVWVNGEAVMPYYLEEPDDPQDGIIWYEEV